MRKKPVFFILVFAVFILYGDSDAQKKDLPPRFKKWLNEEVVYIITPMEKEVFFELSTDRERDLFIQAFWRQRDPTPSSPVNEAREEHYRRIEYANHFFGRATPKAGWRTDRGRIYIILGEPNDIQRIEGSNMVYNSVIWFYQGKTKLGLPPGFNLVFYQEGGTGEYKLYSPVRDGPQAFLTSYSGDPMDYTKAYEYLREFEPNLAEVSLSLIPGERAALGAPSLSSDLMIQKVETVPVRQVKNRYAQKFLEYKDIVEVEYSANYMESDSLVKVIKDPSGTYFVHYAIEPERLSVNLFENKYYTNLKLNGNVSNSEGKAIYQFEKDISIEFDKEKMKSVSQQPLNIHDMFPLIPGNYKLSVLVKNQVSKEFTSMERNLYIPHREEVLQMTSILLGYKVKKRTDQQNILRPFQAGEYQVYFQANRIFLQEDTLFLAFQIHGLSDELKKRGKIRFDFLKNGEEFHSRTKNIPEFTDLPNIMEQFPLKEFPPAHYTIQAYLLLDNREVLSGKERFDISPLGSIARPWIYSKILPDIQNPIYLYLIGTQLYNSGKIEEARDSLEKAFQRKPDSVDFALNLAQAYMALDEYNKIESVLLSFLNQPAPPRYEVFFIMGKAYQNSGELSKAVDLFDRAISHYGLNIHLLNSLGECYFQLGEPGEALAAWEKSLELNQDQPQIRKNVENLKKKK
ncbi:MAG: GWxTD domain-containing protein [Candidatus Aminicenantes bacterium]|jgi:GWxTD domain-containing protein